MSLLFTSHNGEVIEVKDYVSIIKPTVDIPNSPQSLPPSPLMLTPLSIALALRPSPIPLNSFPIATPLNSPPEHHEIILPMTRSNSPRPIITVTNSEKLPASPKMAQAGTLPPVKPQKVEKVRSAPCKNGGVPVAPTVGKDDNPAAWMVYNEYGELVTMEQISKPIVVEELTVTQALRLVYKTYRAEFKDKMREVLSPLLGPVLGGRITTFLDDQDPLTGTKFIDDKLSTSWMFSPAPERSQRSPEDEGRHAVPVYSGPPRVLDIGCADGRWVNRIKKEYPDWIVEGVDDVDQWSNSFEGIPPPRDFMEPLPNANKNDYFCNVHLSQLRPEFTCRNINKLLSHELPIPQNLYSLIRGRDVFARVESYKNFLEDIRHLLQPSGVVEFVEIDPRPRCNYVGRRHSTSDHRSGAETDWTDRIVDRFKDPYDAQLATTIPGWTARVEERLKASLRPRDGVPAAKIKGWLQGAGFWDVKQIVIRLPVGGKTTCGQKLADLTIQEIEIENSIPVLAAELPDINLEDINSGNFYLNLHIVTARKPKFPRPGDLLTDGTRQEMTDVKYEKMAERTGAAKNNSLGGGVEKGGGWKRFDLDLHSTHMVANMVAPLTTLKGGPEQGGLVPPMEGMPR